MKNKEALKGQLFEPSNNPHKLAFLLHGYGDNAENFIHIAKGLYDPETNINFYAPNAPTTLPQYSSGRQWFDLYPNGINFNQAGPKEKKILEEDCLSSLALIRNYITMYCEKFNLTFNDCFIIGFSQGAMMAFEVGKYINQTFAGCVLLSGRILPSQDQHKESFVKSPILVIHGDKDTILEPKYFNEACNILDKQGYFYESHLLVDLEHTISEKTIDLTKKFIKKCMT